MDLNTLLSSATLGVLVFLVYLGMWTFTYGFGRNTGDDSGFLVSAVVATAWPVVVALLLAMLLIVIALALTVGLIVLYFGPIYLAIRCLWYLGNGGFARAFEFGTSVSDKWFPQ